MFMSNCDRFEDTLSKLSLIASLLGMANKSKFVDPT